MGPRSASDITSYYYTERFMGAFHLLRDNRDFMQLSFHVFSIQDQAWTRIQQRL